MRESCMVAVRGILQQKVRWPGLGAGQNQRSSRPFQNSTNLVCELQGGSAVLRPLLLPAFPAAGLEKKEASRDIVANASNVQFFAASLSWLILANPEKAHSRATTRSPLSLHLFKKNSGFKHLQQQHAVLSEDTGSRYKLMVVSQQLQALFVK